MKPVVVQYPCPDCGRPVLRIEDIDTGELVCVDAEPVDEGTVAVYRVARHAFARRYGRPARVQPAWREHPCPSASPIRGEGFTDPYEDVSPAAQQHGGWRA